MTYLLHHAIDNSADLFPDKVAFRCLNQSLTYQELSVKTNQLAAHLVRSGVKNGDRIGIYLNRCLDTPVAIYGILKAGAAYVPLNPGAPESHSRFIINDCGVEILISNKAQRRGVTAILEEKSSLKQVIGLAADLPTRTIPWEHIYSKKEKPNLKIPVLENDLAYILYTSGSTGVPKGIMHTHHSGLSYARLATELYDLTSQDCLANHSPIHFDISTLGYFAAPYVGATTVILSDAHTKMPASQARLIEEEKISVWYSVPLALLQMLQANVVADLSVDSLRWVLFAGEPFNTKHLKSLMLSWPKARFSNIYGPTELNQCTYYHLTEPPKSDAPIPIGKVWGNTSALVIEEEGSPVEEGDVGELVVRSPTMMYGYWKKPELNANCFFRHLNNAGIEEVYYRTGDLVKTDSTGEFLFLGRKDRQVKVRGYRVELDEIANVLLKSNDVVEAAAFLVKDDTGANDIHAQVILKAGKMSDSKVLMGLLNQYLPRYAIPQSVAVVDSFPRTSTGKIDHLQLARDFKKLN